MKKKYKAILFIIGLYFFSPILCSSTGKAWLNGNEICRFPLSYKTADAYGTHDYIAEYALNYISKYISIPADKLQFLHYIRDNKYAMNDFFLAGTDMPDAVRLRDKNGNLIEYGFNTRCGNPFSSAKDMAKFRNINHQLRFGSDRSYVSGSLKPLAQHLAKKLYNAFNLRDGQLAAYYLGAICHCIGDATEYSHLIDGVYDWRKYAECVQFLTRERYWQHTTSSSFFEPGYADDYFTTHAVKREPDRCVVMAGRETMFGGYYLETRSWIYFNASEMPIYNPERPNDAWGWAKNYLNKKINYWTRTDFNKINCHPYHQYFATVQFNINTAIYFCMSMMAKVVERYDGGECDSDHGDYGGQTPNLGDKQADANQQKIQQRLDEYRAFFYFSFAGMLLSLIALGLSLKSAKDIVIPVS